MIHIQNKVNKFAVWYLTIKQFFMKLFILSILTIFTISFANAQSPIGEGGVQFNGALGIHDKDATPVFLGLDYGIAPNFTVGANAGIGGSLLLIGANGNYHFDELLSLPSKWNVYGGANIGLYSFKQKSALDLGLQIGGRYFFSDTIGANLEFGGGTNVTGAKLGVSIVF